jgi:hypothetical protein
LKHLHFILQDYTSETDAGYCAHTKTKKNPPPDTSS